MGGSLSIRKGMLSIGPQSHQNQEVGCLQSGKIYSGPMVENGTKYQGRQLLTRFTGMILPSGKARTAPRYRYHKQYVTLLEGKSTRPAVGHSGPSTALRALSDTPHRTAARASSSEPEWLMKWVNNCRPWYNPAPRRARKRLKSGADRMLWGVFPLDRIFSTQTRTPIQRALC